MEVYCPCGAAYTFDHEVSGHTFTCRCGRRLTTGASVHQQPAQPAAAVDLLGRVADETARRRNGDRSLALLVGVAVAVLIIVAVASIVAGRRHVPAPPSSQPGATARPATPTPTQPRPATGTVLAGMVLAEQYGILRVANGSGQDAAVKLTRGITSETALLFFVRSGETALMEHVPDGRYSLVFGLGRRWNASRLSFDDGAFYRFDGTFSFETEESAAGMSYTEHEVTLHAVRDGNIRAKLISEGEF
jgi:hypothetical protein